VTQEPCIETVVDVASLVGRCGGRKSIFSSIFDTITKNSSWIK